MNIGDLLFTVLTSIHFKSARKSMFMMDIISLNNFYLKRKSTQREKTKRRNQFKNNNQNINLNLKLFSNNKRKKSLKYLFFKQIQNRRKKKVRLMISRSPY